MHTNEHILVLLFNILTLIPKKNTNVLIISSWLHIIAGILWLNLLSISAICLVWKFVIRYFSKNLLFDIWKTRFICSFHSLTGLMEYSSVDTRKNYTNKQYFNNILRWTNQSYIEHKINFILSASRYQIQSCLQMICHIWMEYSK